MDNQDVSCLKPSYHSVASVAFWRRALTLLGGFAVYMQLGCMYTIASVVPYVSSYMRYTGQKEVRHADLGWLFTSSKQSFPYIAPLEEKDFSARCLFRNRGVFFARPCVYVLIDVSRHPVAPRAWSSLLRVLGLCSDGLLLHFGFVFVPSHSITMLHMRCRYGPCTWRRLRLPADCCLSVGMWCNADALPVRRTIGLNLALIM